MCTSKDRCAVHAVCWTPGARRCLSGSANGMFTLWNGAGFNFETTQQAHDGGLRSLAWSNSQDWMLSADANGVVKYWQTNLNNVKELKCHDDSAVREVHWSPTDAKFVTCGDDATVRVWDFERAAMERLLPGAKVENGKSHAWDVKAAQWHPQKALIASGSKDNIVRLWDPKASKEVCSLHLHKGTVNTLRWHPSGNFFCTGSRDQLLKLFDIRAMKELLTFKGHKKEVTAAAWHPHHPELLASGCYDGTIFFWSTITGASLTQAHGAHGSSAHDKSVLSLAWHPIGHLLCSGAEDNAIKFWSRNRPHHLVKDPDEEGGDGEEKQIVTGAASLSSVVVTAEAPKQPSAAQPPRSASAQGGGGGISLELDGSAGRGGCGSVTPPTEGRSPNSGSSPLPVTLFATFEPTHPTLACTARVARLAFDAGPLEPRSDLRLTHVNAILLATSVGVHPAP